MAKFEPKNKPVEATPEVEENLAKAPSADGMQAILDRLDKLEKENEELKKGQMNVFTAGKERYDGPRAYCYKMWGGVPVLAFQSYKKDKTKDLVFKNQFGVWESNHYLKLTLADDTEVDVEVNEFNKNRTLSDKIIAEKRTDNKGNLVGFAFNTEEYGEIIVSPNLINE